MRTTKTLVLAVLALALCNVAAAQTARALNMKSQPMRAALKDLGEQAGVQILFRAEDVARDAKAAPAVSGQLSVREALDRLLADTGLKYEFVNERTVRVARADEGAKKSPEGMKRVSEGSTRSPENPDPAAVGDQKESTKQNNNENISGNAGDEGAIAEIVVTAQKRIERLQDVPVPVTSINANALVDSNQLRLQDYYTRIPGLSVAATPTYGGSSISIRGLSSGALSATASTVGVVVDDVQYSGSGQGLSSLIPEVDPTDLARIEVLRGPQGTLYGANSLGGLLKYVTVDPSTQQFSAHIRGGMVSVAEGDELGYNLNGALNVPFNDSLAVRASGFTRRDPGYIDDPTHNREDINEVRTSGGRVAGLWKPSEDFSLKLSALHQDAKAYGWNQITLLPTSGDLEQNALPGTGGYHKTIQIYTANLATKLGSVDLTAVSAYADVESAFFLDLNPGGPAAGFFGSTANSAFGVTGVQSAQSALSNKFTQEVRAVFPVGDRFEWLLGAFYADDDKRVPSHFTARSYATGAEAGSLGDFLITTSFEEVSVFTNATFRLTDKFDIQVGGRQGHYKTKYASNSSGRFFGNVTTIGPTLTGKDDAFTYLVTPRFKVSQDLMLYARVASGYRTGGANTSVAVGVPPTYAPDKTRNYEVGVKGNAFNGMLSFDASMYYIDWDDIQLTVREPTISAAFVSNAGKATSKGVEFSVESRPLTGLTVAAWVAYNDAALSEDLPPSATTAGTFGRAGDRLPLNTRWSSTISLNQELPLTSTVNGFLGGSLSYVGERAGSFRTSAIAPRPMFPSYTRLDLRAGVRYESWDLNLFANNVTDKRAILDGDAALSPNFTFIQPRTIGISASKTF